MSNSSDRLTAAFDQVKKDIRMLTSSKTYEQMSQNQVIGALTVLLLVVGVAAGVYLGGQQQELRQQASNAYPQCSNSSGACFNHSAGGQCTAFTGGPGTCQNSETDANCTCIPNQVPTTVPACVTSGGNCDGSVRCCNDANGEVCLGSMCQIPPNICESCIPATGICPNGGIEIGTCALGGQLGRCCVGGPSTPTPVQCVPARTCTPGGNGPCCDGQTPVFHPSECFDNSRTWCPPPATPRPTNTSVPNNTPGAPTNTPVPLPTSVPPTNVPPTNVPPTNTPGGPTNTPTNTPTSTPVIAPVCVNVTLNNPASTTPNTPPNIGDVVTLTCSQVAGATRYEFRIRLPDLSYVNVNPSVSTIYVSQQYQIPSAGAYSVACRPCATLDASSCAPWEN